MKNILRNKCVVSENEDLELIYSLKNFPVFMGCVEDKDSSKDEKLDMNFFISRTTGSVQLNPLVPLSILYKDSHGSGSIGISWQKHHNEFSNFILKFNVKNIFEIGGGHGNLAKMYIDKNNNNVKWTVLEANPTPSYDYKEIIFQKGLFDNKCKIEKGIDAIVHSHLFEHIYDISPFVEKLYKSLPMDGYTIFSVPYLEQQIKENITYCLGFEHTLFLNEVFIEYFLEKNNFEIIEKKIYEKNHSIFYCAQKKEKSIEKVIQPNKYEEYSNLFTQYFLFNQNKVEEINRLIDNTKEDIYLFGGHVASQYLINYGLNTKKIKAILDNDPKKHGKRLYGTNFIVYSPEILKNLESASVILRQGIFNDEIKNDIITNINSNIRFLE